MRRIDRAIFAIFLLALVADVARSYASTPVSSEVSGSLILSAASQLQNSGSDVPVLVHRRGGSYSPFVNGAHRTSVLRSWSKALLHPSAQWSQIALLQPAAVVAILAQIGRASCRERV